MLCTARRHLADTLKAQVNAPGDPTTFVDVHGVVQQWYRTADTFSALVLIGGARVILNLRVSVCSTLR